LEQKIDKYLRVNQYGTCCSLTFSFPDQTEVTDDTESTTRQADLSLPLFNSKAPERNLSSRIVFPQVRTHVFPGSVSAAGWRFTAGSCCEQACAGKEQIVAGQKTRTSVMKLLIFHIPMKKVHMMQDEFGLSK